MTLYKKTAHELHDDLVQKKFSAVELTENLFKRIDDVEPKVHAFLTLTKEAALQKAQAIDKKISNGETLQILEGIPCAIKDNICTDGVKTTCASKILENFIPPYNATVIQKLAGSIMLGKTNMDEFAMGGSTEHSAFGATHNPWNLNCVPGGSSGGSAASVAAGEAIFALGSDTGGSIRQPAAFCGIVGLKPTYGRVSRYGLVAFASSLDQIGPLARDVEDCANVFAKIYGYDQMDSTSAKDERFNLSKVFEKNIRGLKIGLPKECFGEGLHDSVRTAVMNAAKNLESLGAEICEISLPHMPYAIATYYLIAPAEAATNLERYDGVSYGMRADGDDIVDLMKNTRTKYFGREVKRRIMIGNYALSAGYYDAYYLKALKVRTLIQKDYFDALEKVDVILTPTSSTTTYEIGSLINDPLAMYLQDIYTVTANLAGLPAISIPCGLDEKNHPIGLQLIGKAMDEETILKAAYNFEQNFYRGNQLPEL